MGDAAVGKASRSAFTVLLSVSLAFFPKCPVCWATYMSAFGSVWLARTPYAAWLFPVLMVVSGLNLLLLLKRGFGPFLLGLAGIAVILGGRSFLPQERWLLFGGMVLMIAGSLTSSLSIARSRCSSPISS